MNSFILLIFDLGEEMEVSTEEGLNSWITLRKITTNIPLHGGLRGKACLNVVNALFIGVCTLKSITVVSGGSNEQSLCFGFTTGRGQGIFLATELLNR